MQRCCLLLLLLLLRHLSIARGVASSRFPSLSSNFIIASAAVAAVGCCGFHSLFPHLPPPLLSCLLLSAQLCLFPPLSLLLSSVCLSVALSLSGTRVWLPMRPFVSCGSSRRTVVATSPEFCLLCCCCCCYCVLLLSLALPLPPLSYCHFRFLSLAVLPQLRLEFSRVEFIVRSSVL